MTILSFPNLFPSQGVDIKPSEDLFIHCPLINHFNKDENVLPKFITRLRSPFGQIVEVKDTSSSEITLKKGEKKEIKLLVPGPAAPQAYEAVLAFREGNKVVSNSASFHYVIVGESATIQNVRLDKPSYKKGEKAKIFFMTFISTLSQPHSADEWKSRH